MQRSGFKLKIVWGGGRGRGEKRRRREGGEAAIILGPNISRGYEIRLGEWARSLSS